VATRLLIGGVSTRAAAESAVRSGFDVVAIDAFGDLDHHPAVRALSISRDFGQAFTADAVARAAAEEQVDAVAYLSSFENHPRALAILSAGRSLWGNPPAVLRRVRSPMTLEAALRRRGLPVPRAYGGMSRRDRVAQQADEPLFREALIKPVKSGGGHHVQRWAAGGRIARGSYVQEFIAGTPGSIVFVAAAGRAVPLGISRQLIGDASFGSAGFQYCGSILAPAGDEQFDRDQEVASRACALVSAIADDFGLVGVNGVDFVARDGQPYAIEVNPRWCSSMELVERANGLSVFGAHAAACASGSLPDFDLGQARAAAAKKRTALGKAIVFARRDVVVGDADSWLSDETVRDVPHPGESIAAGRPVCTVFACGNDSATCYENLVARARRVYDVLAAWAGHESVTT
jgi:predicted ATP-grasp superfamily ATP-dependent carboligase